MAEEASKLRGLEARVAALKTKFNFLLQFMRRMTTQMEERKKALISKRREEIYPALSLSKAAQTLPTPRRPAFHIPRPSRTEPRQFQAIANSSTTIRRVTKSTSFPLKFRGNLLCHETKKQRLPTTREESTKVGICEYRSGTQNHNLRSHEEIKKEIASLMMEGLVKREQPEEYCMTIDQLILSPYERTNFQARMERIKEDFEGFCEKKKEELGKLTPATPPEMSKPDPVDHPIRYQRKGSCFRQLQYLRFSLQKKFQAWSGRCYTPEELEKRRKEIGKTVEDPAKTKVAEDEAADFLRIIKSSEYSVVKQLSKMPFPYISTGTVTRIRVSQESSTEDPGCIQPERYPSSLHQKMKLIIGSQLVTILAEEPISIYNDGEIPYIDGCASEEASFHSFEFVTVIHRVAAVEPKLSRAGIMVAREFVKAGFQPGQGLGCANQGRTAIVTLEGNKDRYGLGYTPTRKDRQIAYEARRQRAAAKLRGEKWPEKKMGDVDELALLFAEDLNVNAITTEGDSTAFPTHLDQYEEVDLESILDEEDLKRYRIEEETFDEDNREEADLPDLLSHLMISRGLETLEFEMFCEHEDPESHLQRYRKKMALYTDDESLNDLNDLARAFLDRYRHNLKMPPPSNITTTIAEEEYAGPMVEGLSIHTIAEEEDSTYTTDPPLPTGRRSQDVDLCAIATACLKITRKTSNDPHVSEIDNKTNCSLDNIDNSDEEIELPNDILEALERQDEGSKPNIEELEIVNLANEGEEPREVKIGTSLHHRAKGGAHRTVKRVPRDLRLVLPRHAGPRHRHSGPQDSFETRMQAPNIVPVPKKDGKVRMCVDYRDLNRASPKDNFPLPHIDTLVDNTATNAVFSFMDGFSGYNQIKMAEEDKSKTAFVTHWGTFVYHTQLSDRQELLRSSRNLNQKMTPWHKEHSNGLRSQGSYLANPSSPLCKACRRNKVLLKVPEFSHRRCHACAQSLPDSQQVDPTSPGARWKEDTFMHDKELSDRQEFTGASRNPDRKTALKRTKNTSGGLCSRGHISQVQARISVNLEPCKSRQRKLSENTKNVEIRHRELGQIRAQTGTRFEKKRAGSKTRFSSRTAAFARRVFPTRKKLIREPRCVGKITTPATTWNSRFAESIPRSDRNLHRKSAQKQLRHPDFREP
uniref:G-patch domain-containing protein n=1 Tax=Fagus sylvatica TaxID=28930 RepID=A0A2N9FX50_FAGSY